MYVCGGSCCCAPSPVARLAMRASRARKEGAAGATRRWICAEESRLRKGPAVRCPSYSHRKYPKHIQRSREARAAPSSRDFRTHARVGALAKERAEEEVVGADAPRRSARRQRRRGNGSRTGRARRLGPRRRAARVAARRQGRRGRGGRRRGRRAGCGCVAPRRARRERRAPRRGCRAAEDCDAVARVDWRRRALRTQVRRSGRRAGSGERSFRRVVRRREPGGTAARRRPRRHPTPTGKGSARSGGCEKERARGAAERTRNAGKAAGNFCRLIPLLIATLFPRNASLTVY
jgi:hypothetical protein